MSDNKNKTSNKEGNDYLFMAGGVGAYGVTVAAVTGAVCPACLVITPALVGAGIYKKMKSKKENKDAE